MAQSSSIKEEFLGTIVHLEKSKLAATNTPVKYDFVAITSNGTIEKAIAQREVENNKLVGVIVEINNSTNEVLVLTKGVFKTTYFNTIDSVNITYGTKLYLSDVSAGKLKTVPPTTGVGKCISLMTKRGIYIDATVVQEIFMNQASYDAIKGNLDSFLTIHNKLIELENSIDSIDLSPLTSDINLIKTNLNNFLSITDVTLAGEALKYPKVDENKNLTAEGFNGTLLSGKRITNPIGAEFISTSTDLSTGAIKVKLPKSWSNTTVGATIKVFDSANGESFDVLIDGYLLSNGASSQWASATAKIIADKKSARNFAVRFGHDGGTCCVWIGETSSTWNFLQVHVTDVVLGRFITDVEGWKKNWSISVVTAFDTVNITVTDTQIGRNILNSQLTPVATGIIKGRVSAGTGDVEDLTVTQLRTFIGNASASLDGLMSIADKVKLDGATSANTASKLVIRDASGNFSAGTVALVGLTVSGTTTLTGALTANGGISATTINASGNSTVGGTFTVTGVLTANGGLTGTTGSFSSTLAVTGNTTLTGDLSVNGGDITTSATTFNLINTVATTINFGSAATTFNIGTTTATSTLNIGSGATISGATQTINFGTCGVAGSITNVNIGASVGTSNVKTYGTFTHTGTMTATGKITAPTFIGALSGNASTATKLATARSISIGGAVSGTATFDGSGDIVITTTNPNVSFENLPGTIITRDSNGDFAAGTITATLAGNAATTSRWATPRTVSLTGDVTGSFTIDGTGNVSFTATYKNSGVVAGTYKSVTVDAKGNITAGTNPTTLAGYGITDATPSSHIGTNGSSHAIATQSLNGFMSAVDKINLDKVPLLAQGLRNSFLCDGGELKWGITANVFSWSKAFNIYPAQGTLILNGLPFKKITIAASNVTLSSVGQCVYITVPTSYSDATNLVGTCTMTVADATTVSGTDKIILYVRDADNCLQGWDGWIVYGTIVQAGGKRDAYVENLFTTANDFIVGAGSRTFAKKTLAETRVILGNNNNIASTLVLRDASGNFSAGTITATLFSGSGASLNSLNASNLSSGIIPDARISGSYTGMANLTGSGTVDFAKFLGNSADTVSAPSFSWTGDLDTGIYTPGADQIAIATGGVQRLLINSTGITAATFIGALSGNATTATTLQTARTINGVSFNGSANITIADSTKLALTGGTLTGALAVGGTGIGVSNTSATTGYGISLYGGVNSGLPTYGLAFAGTDTFGTHGTITSDWATYFTMNNTAGIGWVFRNVTTSSNVASIDNVGNATFNKQVTAESFKTGSCEIKYNATTKSLDFNFA